MYRRYRMPTLWREMERLQNEMNRLFDAYFPAWQRTPSYPALNIWSNKDGLLITAEVPGVGPEDMDIQVAGDTLTLSGQRKPEQPEGNVRYHRQERGFGSFHRAIQLPYTIDASKVEATFRNGILQINLPRAEEDKPRKIAVKTA